MVWLPFFIVPYIGFLIIPIDVHIFQRGGWTTNQQWTTGTSSWTSLPFHPRMLRLQLTNFTGVGLADGDQIKAPRMAGDLWHRWTDQGGCILKNTSKKITYKHMMFIMIPFNVCVFWLNMSIFYRLQIDYVYHVNIYIYIYIIYLSSASMYRWHSWHPNVSWFIASCLLFFCHQIIRNHIPERRNMNLLLWHVLSMAYMAYIWGWGSKPMNFYHILGGATSIYQLWKIHS